MLRPRERVVIHYSTSTEQKKTITAFVHADTRAESVMDAVKKETGSGPYATTTGLPEGYMVSAAGFEPATHALKGHCSTT